MADKEITIKVTANTDGAEKGLDKVADKIEKMSQAGSGKAADELDKVTDAAAKASSATETLNAEWDEYAQKVKDAESAVRSLNATQFENAEQRDAAINTLGDKLDDLVIEGKTLEDAVKAIGLRPDALNGFNSIVSILERANSEFQIALNNRDKLLNQPTAPENPLVATNPWDDGPDSGGPNEFQKRFADLRAEFAGFQQELTASISAFDQLKEALRSQYESLDRNSAGYLEQKKLLERLITTSENYSVSLETQRQQLGKQVTALDELKEETEKTQDFEGGMKALDEYGEKAVVAGQKVVTARQKMVNVQEIYNNAVIAGQDKELNGQKKIQAQMEVAGKSREELIALVEEYNRKMASAATAEEYKAAQAGLAAARKQLTLVTREATLTGASMLGAQTSVQGLATAIGRLGVTGRLTFQGLTNGVKMFAKSTLVLAGIQFAWEALSKIYEKVKGDLFGVAEAEEAAAERAEKLAAAAKEAADNLASAQKALRESQADQARADAAKAYADVIAQQNEHLNEQLKLIEGTTNAILFQQTLTAKDEEQKIAIEKEKLQREKMLGLIDEYEYERRILELNEKAVELRAKSKVDAATAKRDAAAQRAKVERQNLEEIEGTALEELGATPEELAALIAQFEKNEANIQKYEKKYQEREELKKKLQGRRELYNAQLAAGNVDPVQSAAISEMEEDLRTLNEVLKEVDGLIIQNEAISETLPQQIKDAQSLGEGLAEYTKDYKDRVKYNEGIEKQRKEALKRVKEAEAAELEASDALTRENQSFAQITTQTAELNREKYATLNAKEEIERDVKANEAKIEKARDEVRKMEYSALKRQAAEMSAWASLTGESTPEGRIRRALADVYQQEYQRRLESGLEAAERVTDGLDASGNKVITNAAELARRAGSGRDVALNKVATVLEQALKTSGTEDDIAAQRLYDIISRLVTVTDKNARQMRSLKNKYEALKKKTANLDS